MTRITIVANTNRISKNSTEPNSVEVLVSAAKNVSLSNSGPQGAQGESAYDIAVSNGFVGTELEWLDSLSATNATKTTTTLLASGAIGGSRIVITNGDGTASYADATNQNHKHKIIGITENAANNNDVLTIITSGELTDNAFNFTTGTPIFLGVNGLLTQTAPSSPSFQHIIGVAKNSTTIIIQQNQPILLA